ncbi:MAG: hypothetical protein PHH06_00885 [Candidatus Gracilibacteria bacterium]|nr:hypothetical protein [Candidatus Gracilibacteria bacterium]
MAVNNTPKTPETGVGVEQTQEKPGSLSEKMKLACETSTKAALLALSMTCATPAMADNQDALNQLKPGTESTVMFKGGGEAILKVGKNGEYTLVGGDSQDGKDVFEGTTTIAGEKYLVISTGPDYPLEVIAEKDAHIYKEYADKLPEGLENFAYELFKARAEFIANIVKTERFDRLKTPERKEKMAKMSWDSILKQLFVGGESSGYKYIPENASGLTQYILENYDELSQSIGQPIVAIRDEYEIMEDKRAIEEDKRAIEEDKRAIEAYKKVLKHVGK